MTVRERFAANLRGQRHLAGLSQEAVGFRSGLHRTEVGLLERAERTPRIDTLVKLAGALGCESCDLLAGMEWRPGRVEVSDPGGYAVSDG